LPKKKLVRKVLIISYYWPPAGGAGVQRWLKFAKYLPEFGWEPIVYTPENPESPALDPSLLNDVPRQATVIKTPIWEPLDWYKKFTGKNKEEKLGAGFLSENASVGFSEKVARWIRGNFFIPDAKCFWIRPSVRYLTQYLRENPVDLIVSTGPPHTTHLIAMKLKEKLKLKWIADFRDPWTEIDFFDQLKLSGWARRKHHRLEGQVICRADQVITVGRTLSESFEKRYGAKVRTLTNGYDEDDFSQDNKVMPDSGQFSLVHVGSINKDRNHRIFWQALQELVSENEDFRQAIEVHFIGKTDLEVKNDAERFQLSSFVRYTPYLDHNQVLEQEQQASVLFLPVNNTPNSKGILTGKLFEYLASRRPVLAIAPRDGDLAAILSEAQAGLVSDFDDKDGFKNNLLSLFRQYQRGSLSKSQSGIEAYSRRNLTGSLANEMNNIVS